MLKDPFILPVPDQTYFVHSRVDGARAVKLLLLLLPMLTSVELRRFGSDGDGDELRPDGIGRIAVRVGIERGRPAPEDGRRGEEWPVLLNISSEHLPNFGVILLKLQAVPRWIAGFALRTKRALLRLVGKLYRVVHGQRNSRMACQEIGEIKVPHSLGCALLGRDRAEAIAPVTTFSIGWTRSRCPGGRISRSALSCAAWQTVWITYA